MHKILTGFALFWFIFSFPVTPQDKIPEKWKTRFEKSGFLESPRYSETMDYFRKFSEFSPFVRFNSIGVSPQGREINYLIVSKDKCFTPEEAHESGKPILLIISGIHSGEIEGKDASMLLLREILVTKEKEFYLDSLILLVVPIFSVDGHERSSAFSRINQNGPVEQGWRTTAQNLNLNRDWLKADAPEMQALLRLFSVWLPDLWIDSHTTDGADHQYTLTYGLEKFANVESGLADFTKNELIPHIEKYVTGKGYLVAPYVGFVKESPENGLYDWVGLPRLSNGYGAAQNRICFLIETHMIKPYKERVFSTKAGMESFLELLYHRGSYIKKLNNDADGNSRCDYGAQGKWFPLTFSRTQKSTDFLYKGFETIGEESNISGTKKIKYTNIKKDMTVPFYNDMAVTDSVKPAKFYFIPEEWESLVKRLELHGVVYKKLTKDTTFRVTRYKFKDVKLSEVSYEGRQTVTCSYDTFTAVERIPAGTFLIPTNQRAVRVIVHALEPKSPDSFLRWGFMNSIFERKEYFEWYVMEEVALKMYNEDPILRKEFDKRLSEDEKFRNEPYARLNFFYERSPYFDKKLNLYPIFRFEF